MEYEINYNETIEYKRYFFRTKAVNKVIRSLRQPSLPTNLKTYGVLITAADYESNYEDSFNFICLNMLN